MLLKSSFFLVSCCSGIRLRVASNSWRNVRVDTHTREICRPRVRCFPRVECPSNMVRLSQILIAVYLRQSLKHTFFSVMALVFRFPSN